MIANALKEAEMSGWSGKYFNLKYLGKYFNLKYLGKYFN